MTDAKPHGLGLFYGSADMQTPKESAQRCIASGASWAGVLAQSVDGRKQPATRVAAACDALRALDVVPWLYSFPTPGMPAQSPIRHLRECAEMADVDRVCWDIEPYEGHDWSQPQVDALLEAFPTAAVTLYERPQWHRLSWHGRQVWLQVYSAAKDAAKLAAVGAKWPGAVPCFGAYDGGVSDMAADAARCVTMARAADAAAVWSLASVSPAKADALRTWAASAWPPKRP